MTMSIIVAMSGWETKGLATTGEAVSPSLRKMKPLNELALMGTNPICYGERFSLY